MPERRAHPVGAVFIGLLTLALTLVVALIGFLPISDLCGLVDCTRMDSFEPNYLAAVVIWLVSAAILVGGLWCARRVGTGGKSRR